MNREWKRVTYIYWRKEAEFSTITNEEFEDKVAELTENDWICIKPTTRRFDYFNKNTFSLEHDGNYFRLKYIDKDGFKPKVYTTNWFDDSKNER